VVEQALKVGRVDIDHLAVGPEVAVTADQGAACTVDLHGAEGIVEADELQILIDVAGRDAGLGAAVIAAGEKAQRAATDPVREAWATEPAARTLAGEPQPWT